jgi:alpha-mannosidase
MDDRIIAKKLQLLQGLAVTANLPLTGWEARTADHVADDKYAQTGAWRPAILPASFKAGKTVFLRTNIAVPASVPLADAYLSFEFQELEGLLSINGQPYAGIDWGHARVALPARGRLRLEIEFMAVPSIFHAPELASRPGVFAGASIRVVSRPIEAFCWDVRFAWETAKVIADPVRKPLLEQAIEAALLAVDLTLPRPRLLAEVQRAQWLLKRKLAAIAPDPAAGRLFATGHTHIDTAWLWPLRETVRKCGRTFATACRLMERYPDFYFSCSQPQLYQYTKQYFPDVYRQIKRWVRAGRWETTGAMWVEADCNVPSGESLIRQILHGIAFFRREFGTRPRLCWLPDVFGYPSSLPEILAGCGINSFYTYKLHWQAFNHFPVNLFRWRGLDGSEVIAHVVNHVGAYNNYPNPDQLFKGWNMYAQKAEYPEVIFPFGYGDGGGGASEDMLEMLRRAEGQFPGLPAVRTGPAERFFADIAKARPALPVWDGELYVETHRGTYTTQSQMKRANRVSELLLREAEIYESMAGLLGKTTRAAALRAAWKTVLLYQFHDILPGSSIGMVYQEALPVHARLQESVARTIDRRLASLAPKPAAGAGAGVCVFNSLAWPRQDLVTAEIPAATVARSVPAADGARRPVQTCSRRGGKATILFYADGLPSLGDATLPLSAQPANLVSPLAVSKTKLENKFFRMLLDGNGAIARLVDKLNGREVIARGALGNDLQLLQDGPENEDAWNIHETSDRRRYPFEGKTAVRMLETGPVRAMVRVIRTHRNSRLEQDIAIYADLPRIDFITRVDWQERQTMLKAAFPLAIRSTRATYEVQFGAYERPTHRNTSWDQQKFEVPAQRWADLSEAGYGVSLLNDSRYGYDAKDNFLRLTLLRGTTFPDPQADRGRHEFTYALYPHAGGWAEGGTVRRAWELNAPLRALFQPKAGSGRTARSFISLTGAAAVVEALKPAEDGRGFILRIYEPHGGRGAVTVHLPELRLRGVRECNQVEENGAEVALRHGAFECELAPFQIRAFRLT